MDELDPDKLAEVLSILREAGVLKFRFDKMTIEFPDPEPESVQRPAGFNPVKPDDAATSKAPSNYSRVFGGQVPTFTPAKPVPAKE